MNAREKATGDAILVVEDLTVSYGRVQAVRGVSFSVPRGGLVTLVGANGAGVPLDRPSPISDFIDREIITPAQVTRVILSMIPAIAEADWWTGDESQLPRFMPEERPDIITEGRRYVESGGIVKYSSAPWLEKIWDDWIPATEDPEACCRDCADGLACHCGIECGEPYEHDLPDDAAA